MGPDMIVHTVLFNQVFAYFAQNSLSLLNIVCDFTFINVQGLAIFQIFRIIFFFLHLLIFSGVVRIIIGFLFLCYVFFDIFIKIIIGLYQEIVLTKKAQNVQGKN